MNSPVSITYEQLSKSPRDTVAIILSALGLDPGMANSVSPRTRRMADNESKVWCDRLAGTCVSDQEQ